MGRKYVGLGLAILAVLFTFVIGNFAPSNSGKVESSVIGKIQPSKT
jgi:hypothetical protein